MWLVKSSNQIVGPYNTQEVMELLKSRQISTLDEICEPQARWTYIRENKTFLETVKLIKKEIDHIQESTQTATITSQTTTKTDRLDIITRPENIDSTKVEKNTLEDIKVYGLKNNSIEKSRVYRKWTTRLLSLVVAVSVVGFLALYYYQEKNKEYNYHSLLKQALRFKEILLYDQSLSAFKKAQAIKKVSLEIELKMAPILVSEDRQTAYTRRLILEALDKKIIEPAQLVDYYLSLVRIGLLDQDLNFAEEYLQKIQNLDSENIWFKLNLAVFYYYKSDFKNSIKVLKGISLPAVSDAKIYDVKKIRDYYMTLYGWIALRSSDPEFAKDWLDLYGQTYKSVHYKYLAAEQAVIKLALLQKKQNFEEFNQTIQDFITSPIGDQSQFVKDVYLDFSIFAPEKVLKLCESIYNQDSEKKSLLKAFLSLCLMQNNMNTDAEKYLQQALVETESQQLVEQAYFWSLLKSGKKIEAKALLKKMDISSTIELQTFRLHSCIADTDNKCLLDIYQSLELEQRSPLLYSSLAWSYVETNDRFKAYEVIKEGLNNYPSYLPLLELRNHLEIQ